MWGIIYHWVTLREQDFQHMYTYKALEMVFIYLILWKDVIMRGDGSYSHVLFGTLDYYKIQKFINNLYPGRAQHGFFRPTNPGTGSQTRPPGHIWKTVSQRRKTGPGNMKNCGGRSYFLSRRVEHLLWQIPNFVGWHGSTHVMEGCPTLRLLLQRFLHGKEPQRRIWVIPSCWWNVILDLNNWDLGTSHKTIEPHNSISKRKMNIASNAPSDFWNLILI